MLTMQSVLSLADASSHGRHSILPVATQLANSRNDELRRRDPCAYNCGLSPNAKIVIVRPFSRVDVGTLEASFDRWNEFPPCVLNADGKVYGASPRADLVL